MADRFRIRAAELTDVPAVHAIEQRVFADPWSTQDFRDCVSFALFLVAEEQDTIAGYVVALEAADEGEILNLAVGEGGRRRGLGRALVQAIVEALSERGVRQVYLEVRESNAAARALYATFGFKDVGRRKAYYRRPVEDAIVLRLDA
ncbi:MAG TPA: ribosomal protein S18-alanine N-acetyltransferase [Gemmatimonadales bacterium]|nr:ribosomal protein S18-alanine N-acetyltransferase [Gemmatimonadales bacterium]